MYLVSMSPSLKKTQGSLQYKVTNTEKIIIHFFHIIPHARKNTISCLDDERNATFCLGLKQAMAKVLIKHIFVYSIHDSG